MATTFYMVAPNICGSSLWNLLGPRILKWLWNFWKLCAPQT